MNVFTFSFKGSLAFTFASEYNSMLIELRKRLNRFWFNCLKIEFGICDVVVFRVGCVKEELVVENDILSVDI